jgi:hypothetical protein
MPQAAQKPTRTLVAILVVQAAHSTLGWMSYFYHLAGFRIEVLTGQPYVWPFYQRFSFTLGLVLATCILLCTALYLRFRLPLIGKIIVAAAALSGAWSCTAIPLLLKEEQYPGQFYSLWEYAVGPFSLALALAIYAALKRAHPKVGT